MLAAQARPAGSFATQLAPLSRPTTAGIAEDIGRNLLVYGRRLPKAELFARIDAVSARAGRGRKHDWLFGAEGQRARMGRGEGGEGRDMAALL